MGQCWDCCHCYLVLVWVWRNGRRGLLWVPSALACCPSEARPLGGRVALCVGWQCVASQPSHGHPMLQHCPRPSSLRVTELHRAVAPQSFPPFPGCGSRWHCSGLPMSAALIPCPHPARWRWVVLGLLCGMVGGHRGCWEHLHPWDNSVFPAAPGPNCQQGLSSSRSPAWVLCPSCRPSVRRSTGAGCGDVWGQDRPCPPGHCAHYG